MVIQYEETTIFAIIIYLVLYDVVLDVESDVLDKTDRTGYLCVR